MAKLSKDEWLDIRSLWEADPKLSFGALASEYGISKQVISVRAKNENWKRQCNLTIINQESIRRADAFFEKIDEKTDDREKTDETFTLKKEVGMEEAIDRRTDILVKHRHEIVTLDSMQSEAKSLFDTALKTKKKEDFWMAKIAIDTCKDHIIAVSKKQAMERKCWGMDECDVSPADIAACTNEELDCYTRTHKLPMRFRKIFRSYDDS